MAGKLIIKDSCVGSITGNIIKDGIYFDGNCPDIEMKNNIIFHQTDEDSKFKLKLDED